MNSREDQSNSQQQFLYADLLCFFFGWVWWPIMFIVILLLLFLLLLLVHPHPWVQLAGEGHDH